MRSMDGGIKKRAYGYTRVSTVGQADGVSLSTQEEAIKAYAEKNNIEIVAWFSDPGKSAKNANRPGIQKLVKAVQQNKGKVDYMIVYNMTRASRDLVSYFRYISGPLEDCGVRVLDTTQPYSEDGNDIGIILAQTLSLLTGQVDNATKSKTVTDNMKAVARDGWWLTTPPLGYKIKKVPLGSRNSQGKMRTHSMLEPDGENAEKMIQLLTTFSLGGMSEADAWRFANEIGLRSKQDKPLAQSTVSMYLRMPVYAGFHRHKKLLGGELIKLRSEGLISWEVFQTNQRILGRDSIEHIKSDNTLYPLKGTLHCSVCGSILRASAPKSGSHKASPRYHCPHKGHGSINIKDMNELFINLLDGITPTEGIVKLFKETVKRTAKQKYSDLNKQLDELQNKRQLMSGRIDQVFDEYLSGNISLEEKDTHTNRFISERNRIDDEIMELQKTQRLSEATINYACNFLMMPSKLWRDASLDGRQSLQNIIFPNGLSVDLCAKKCGTEDLGPIFSVITTKNGLSDPSNANVVVPTGIEPVTSGL